MDGEILWGVYPGVRGKFYMYFINAHMYKNNILFVYSHTGLILLDISTKYALYHRYFIAVAISSQAFQCLLIS